MSTSDTNKAAVRACFAEASRGNFDALHWFIQQGMVAPRQH